MEEEKNNHAEELGATGATLAGKSSAATPAVDKLAYMSVGLMDLRPVDENNEAFVAAGSGVVCALPTGTIIILTAAHVIQNLLKRERKAMYCISPLSRLSSPLPLDVEIDNVMIVGGEENGPSGPDYGLIRVPDHQRGKLINSRAPYNLKIRLDYPLTGEEELPDLCLAGHPSTAMTRHVGQDGAIRRDEHTLMVVGGNIGSKSYGADGANCVFEFHPDSSDGQEPFTYQGVSGGGVWRLDAENGEQRPYLLGIAYHQSDADSEGRRVIYCAATESIYRLLGEAENRWK
ncbi:hypothetical protein ASF03_21285 [Rhizobium sp. Leaf68]|nr:hypothetical protein ASE62_20740 [Rhizobium sp. Leaf202]KQN80458.1 hypothetical protein ASF03_21285 [Rhizobium sp. Leaf68]